MENLKIHIISLLKIIVFLILFLIIFDTITYTTRPVSIDAKNIAGLYAEKKNTLDMVYIGGSAAFVYWEALRAFEDTGMSSYVYSANTMQAELYKYMIKEILKNQKPKVILIDARAFQYRDVDQPPKEVPYRNVLTTMPFSYNREAFIEENVKKYIDDDPMAYHFDIIKYHTILSDAIAKGEIYSIGDNLKMMMNKYNNHYKGFYFVRKVAEIEKTNYNTTKITKPYDETDKILDDLLDYLNTIDTKIIFIVSPYQELKSHKEIYNYVEKKVTDKGHIFLDTNKYRDDMGLDYKTDFYNNDHVNIFGADKYTKFLENYLIKNYQFKDYRKDKNFRDWYLYLDEWEDEYDETKNVIEELIRENYE